MLLRQFRVAGLESNGAGQLFAGLVELPCEGAWAGVAQTTHTDHGGGVGHTVNNDSSSTRTNGVHNGKKGAA